MYVCMYVLAIRGEIREIEEGKYETKNNVLKVRCSCHVQTIDEQHFPENNLKTAGGSVIPSPRTTFNLVPRPGQKRVFEQTWERG